MDTVTEAYTRVTKAVPKLTVHLTRGLVTSVATLSGLDWEVIHRTTSWEGNLTFKRHYFRHVNVRSVADAVLSQVIPEDEP